MALFKLRYQDGLFKPLDPAPQFHTGDEIEIEWPQLALADSIDDLLDQTRGMWADWEGIEPVMEESRQQWDEAWQKRISSS